MFDNALQTFCNSVSLGNIADVLKRIENDLQCILNEMQKRSQRFENALICKNGSTVPK